MALLLDPPATLPFFDHRVNVREATICAALCNYFFDGFEPARSQLMSGGYERVTLIEGGLVDCLLASAPRRFLPVANSANHLTLDPHSPPDVLVFRASPDLVLSAVQSRGDTVDGSLGHTLKEWESAVDLIFRSLFAALHETSSYLCGSALHRLPGFPERLYAAHVSAHNTHPVVVTGAGAGGAAAAVAAGRLCAVRNYPVIGVTTFGAPKIGSLATAETIQRQVAAVRRKFGVRIDARDAACSAFGFAVVRVFHEGDAFPTLPAAVCTAQGKPLSTAVHAGDGVLLESCGTLEPVTARVERSALREATAALPRDPRAYAAALADGSGCRSIKRYLRSLTRALTHAAIVRAPRGPANELFPLGVPARAGSVVASEDRSAYEDVSCCSSLSCSATHGRHGGGFSSSSSSCCSDSCSSFSDSPRRKRADNPQQGTVESDEFFDDPENPLPLEWHAAAATTIDFVSARFAGKKTFRGGAEDPGYHSLSSSSSSCSDCTSTTLDSCDSCDHSRSSRCSGSHRRDSRYTDSTVSSCVPSTFTGGSSRGTHALWASPRHKNFRLTEKHCDTTRRFDGHRQYDYDVASSVSNMSINCSSDAGPTIPRRLLRQHKANLQAESGGFWGATASALGKTASRTAVPKHYGRRTHAARAL